MFNLILISLILLLALLSHTLSCRCPRVQRENLTSILNDTNPLTPFTVSPVIINTVDYGLPFVANKLIFLPKDLNYSTGKDQFTQNLCPKGYRPPTKDEIEGIITQLGADALDFFKDEAHFNLTEQKYLITSSRASTDTTNADYNKSAAWTIGVGGATLDYAPIKPARNTYAIWKCIENDASISFKYLRYLFTNEETELTINEPNYPAVQWLINNDTTTASDEIVKKHIFTTPGCYVVEFWALSLNETKHYNCRTIHVAAYMGNNNNNTWDIAKIQYIDTGIAVTQNTGIFFTSSSYPVAPKDDGGFYIFCHNYATRGVQVLEYTEDYVLVAKAHLGIRGSLIDATATPWGFVIYLNEGDQKSVLYGFYANFKMKFNKVVMNNRMLNHLIREQIPFYTGNKGIYFGLNSIYRPDTGKLGYGKGRILLILVHYANFGSGNRTEGHTGDSAYSFDDNGDDARIGFSWGSSHALIEGLTYNGGFFFYSTLGDAYPMNIDGGVLDVDRLNPYIDPVLKYQNTFPTTSHVLPSQYIPGDEKGGSCGRLGGTVTNGTVVVTIYAVKPCKEDEFQLRNVIGFASFYGRDGAIANKTDIAILEGPDAATDIIQVRIGKWGDKILVFILKHPTPTGMNMTPKNYAGNSLPYYMVVDFEGNVIQPMIEAPKMLMSTNEDPRDLRNGDLIWGAIDNKGGNNNTLLVAFMRSDLNTPIVTPSPPTPPVPPTPTP